MSNSKNVLKVFASYSCVCTDQFFDTGGILLGGSRSRLATTVIIIKNDFYPDPNSRNHLLTVNCPGAMDPKASHKLL